MCEHTEYLRNTTVIDCKSIEDCRLSIYLFLLLILMSSMFGWEHYSVVMLIRRSILALFSRNIKKSCFDWRFFSTLFINLSTIASIFVESLNFMKRNCSIDPEKIDNFIHVIFPFFDLFLWWLIDFQLFKLFSLLLKIRIRSPRTSLDEFVSPVQCCGKIWRCFFLGWQTRCEMVRINLEIVIFFRSLNLHHFRSCSLWCGLCAVNWDFRLFILSDCVYVVIYLP